MISLDRLVCRAYGAIRSFIEAGLGTYARADYVAKETGPHSQLCLCKRPTIWLQKGGLVYDLAAIDTAFKCSTFTTGTTS